MTELVSAIIPAFNSEPFIADAIGSVLAQDYPRIELIVVDDGSSDGTPDAVRSFGDRVRYVRQDNHGASAARNHGTRLAAGRYLQYVDADDVLLPGAISARVGALESNHADVAYSSWRRTVVDDHGRPVFSETISTRIEDVDDDIEIAVFTSFWAPPVALLYHRRVVERIGGWNESLPVIQDARFIQDAAMRGARFVHVPQVGAEYRVHGEGSLSRQSAARFVRDVYRNALQVESDWRERNAFTADRRRALYNVLDYTARSLFSCDQDLFRENVSRLYRLEPGFRLSWPKAAALLTRCIGYRGAAALMSALGKPPPIGSGGGR